MKKAWMVPLVLLSLTGCADEAPTDTTEPTDAPFTQHTEPSDLVEVQGAYGKPGGIGSSFDRDLVMSENFFLATDLVTAGQVQRFLEASPYDNRSWLADATIDGLPASAAIVDASREHGINPIVMLARMQVEKGIVSKSSRPSQHSVDFAFGCGCPDNRSCYEGYRGLNKQVACAAETLRKLHDASADGSGAWRAGARKKSLDGLNVTPANHATAALYGYTPWVLQGRGGNWLVWNITLRFARHFQNQGAIDLTDPALGDPFVGTPCDRDEQCLFSVNGAEGFCHRFLTQEATHGFCALLCEGYCPDRAGHASTFCTDLDGVGACVSQASADNDRCAQIKGTSPQLAPRYVGDSGASAREAEVCLPAP